MNYQGFHDEEYYGSERGVNNHDDNDSRLWGSDILNPNLTNSKIENLPENMKKSKRIMILSLQMGLNSQVVLHLLKNIDLNLPEDQIFNTILDQYNKYSTQREADNQQGSTMLLRKSQKVLKNMSSELRRSSSLLRQTRGRGTLSSRVNINVQNNNILANQEQTCPVCFEDIFDEKRKSRLSCGHFTCKNCFDQYLENKIINSQINEIKCPNEGCKLVLLESEIIHFLKSKPILLQKFFKFKNAQEIARNPNMKWCIRPGCEKVVNVKKNSGDNCYMKCECGQEFCYKCNNPWHPDMKCEEFIDKVYKSYIKGAEVKFCPSCQALIEKNDGCNHMTCLQCNFEFCWICEKKYSANHFSPFNLNGCPGLQFANITKQTNPWTKRCLWIKSLLFVILAIILIITIGPLVAIVAGIWLPLNQCFFNKPIHCNNSSDCLINVFKFILLLIVGLITCPITAILLMIAFLVSMARR